MRNYLNFSVLTCLLIGLTTSCKKENIDTPITPVDTEIVKRHLDLSTKNWNDHLSSLAIFKNYKEIEPISTEAQRTALIAELIAPSAIAASGDVLEAQTVRLEPLSTLFANNPTATDLFKTVLEKQIQVGDKIMEITWSKGERPFTTKCIVNEKGIVWDNILYGVYMGQAAYESTTTEREDAQSYVENYQWNQSANWIWGLKRGQMDYTMRIHVTNELVTATTLKAQAYMSSGTSFQQSAILFPQGTQGTAQISLGLATPTAFLKYDENALAVSGVNTQVLNIRKTLYP